MTKILTKDEKGHQQTQKSEQNRKKTGMISWKIIGGKLDLEVILTHFTVNMKDFYTRKHCCVFVGLRAFVCACVRVCTLSAADWRTAPRYQGARRPSSDGMSPFHSPWIASSPAPQHTSACESRGSSRLSTSISHGYVYFFLTWWLVSMSSMRTPSLWWKLWWMGVCCVLWRKLSLHIAFCMFAS